MLAAGYGNVKRICSAPGRTALKLRYSEVALVSRIRSSSRKGASPPLGSGEGRNDGLAGFRDLRRNDGLDNLSNESLKRDTSTTTTGLGWRLHPAFTAGGAASFVGAARPLVA